MIRAIETRYKGYHFRSRLEARWAVFFDALGSEWEYEPEGYVLEDGTKYLPDFWIPLNKEAFPGWGYWVEIKPMEPNENEMLKAQMLSRGTEHTTFIFWGNLNKDDWSTTIFKGQDNGNLWMHGGRYCEFLNEIPLPDGRTAIRVDVDFTDAHNIHHHLPLPENIKWQHLHDLPAAIGIAFEKARAARFEYGETP